MFDDDEEDYTINDTNYTIDIPFHKYLIMKISDMSDFLKEKGSKLYHFPIKNLYSDIIQKRKDKKDRQKALEAVRPIVEKEIEKECLKYKEINDLNSLYDRASNIDEEEQPFIAFDKKDYLKNKN